MIDSHCSVTFNEGENFFFLTDWFWKNSLMESCGLIRTSKTLSGSKKKFPNNFWGSFPQWKWPTGRKAAKHDNGM